MAHRMADRGSDSALSNARWAASRSASREAPRLRAGWNVGHCGEGCPHGGRVRHGWNRNDHWRDRSSDQRHPVVCRLHDSAAFGVDLTSHSGNGKAGPLSLRRALVRARPCRWVPSGGARVDGWREEINMNLTSKDRSIAGGRGFADFVDARGPSLHRTALVLTHQEQAAQDLV
jgi:hypothetical protein